MSSNPHSSRLLALAAAAGLFFAAGAASASSVTFSGELSDCAGNAALVGSGLAPGSADCTNDGTVVNNVALYTGTPSRFFYATHEMGDVFSAVDGATSPNFFCRSRRS